MQQPAIDRGAIENLVRLLLPPRSHPCHRLRVCLQHLLHVALLRDQKAIRAAAECTEHKDSGMPGTSRYVTTKNRKNTPDRIELKKYNPILRKMTVHKEIK